MALRKCPRCELNYILDDGDLCTVCREEVRGSRSRDDAVVMCSVCGEEPALPGEDVCKHCLADLRYIQLLSTDEEDGGDVDTGGVDVAPISEMDEIESVKRTHGGVSLDDDDEEEDEDGEDTDVDIPDDIPLDEPPLADLEDLEDVAALEDLDDEGPLENDGE